MGTPAPPPQQQPILSRAYAERRIVLIVPKTETEAKQTSVDWKTIGTATSFLLLTPAAFLGWKLMSTVYASLAKRKAAGAPPSLGVTLEQAQGELAFPPGHPLTDHAYAGHPLVAARYRPLAGFHQYLFEEKVNELVTLLASLGATRVRVTFRQGYRAAGGIRLGVDVPGQPGGGAVGKTTSETVRTAVFEETYTPTHKPAVPEGLVWYEHEPSWQALARRRLEFGTQTFSTQLSYGEDYGVDARVKLGLEKCGVRLGGSFTEFEATQWDFEGTFAPL